MFKKISYILIAAVLSTQMVFAGATNCGDGDQHYDLSSSGTVVSYAASLTNFTVKRTGEDRIVVTDRIKCRYGTDTLHDIEIVRFLDQELTVNELLIHEETRTLAVDVLKEFVRGQLAQKFVDLGYSNVTEVAIEDDTQTITVGNVTNITPSFSNSDPFASNQFSNNTNTFNTPTNNFGSSFSSNSFATANYAASNYQAPQYSNYGSYNNFAGYSNTYDGFGGQSNSPFPTAQTGAQVAVSWNPSLIGSNDIVYFEATDSQNIHHYLGSSIGYLGSGQVSVPNDVLATGSVTIYVRSGAKILNTFNVQSQ